MKKNVWCKGCENLIIQHEGDYCPACLSKVEKRIEELEKRIEEQTKVLKDIENKLKLENLKRGTQ